MRSPPYQWGIFCKKLNVRSSWCHVPGFVVASVIISPVGPFGSCKSNDPLVVVEQRRGDSVWGEEPDGEHTQLFGLADLVEQPDIVGVVVVGEINHDRVGRAVVEKKNAIKKIP